MKFCAFKQERQGLYFPALSFFAIFRYSDACGLCRAVLAIEDTAVEAAKRGGVVSEDHRGEEAEDHIHDGDGEGDREGTEGRYQKDEEAEECTCDMACDAVV